MDDLRGILSDQPWLKLLHGGLAREGASFEDRFAEARDSFVGVNAEE
jgi:hypothetical protein